ncbi:MAG: hypothetical protein J0G32_07970 [Alphaproteobacteria bacterium]|nr:hypothetical protein [Alphaproteobacteria bacterium]OJV15842.1 MAG: hypothetical protein BGO27_08015 [Alphaproteobacteria bacterium 33-17]
MHQSYKDLTIVMIHAGSLGVEKNMLSQSLSKSSVTVVAKNMKYFEAIHKSTCIHKVLGCKCIIYVSEGLIVD